MRWNVDYSAMCLKFSQQSRCRESVFFSFLCFLSSFFSVIMWRSPWSFFSHITGTCFSRTIYLDALSARARTPERLSAFWWPLAPVQSLADRVRNNFPAASRLRWVMSCYLMKVFVPELHVCAEKGGVPGVRLGMSAVRGCGSNP